MQLWVSALFIVASSLLASSSWAAICGDEMPNNSCMRADDPIQACRSESQRNPASSSARLALCEALAMEKQLDEAKVVITQGIARCSGRDCQRLKLALSYVEEKRAARDRADPREAERKQAADRQFCLTPFNNARSISACERLLLSAPNEEAVYDALINKMLKMGDPSSALAYALQARTNLNSPDLFSNLVANANKQRKAVVDDCLNDDSLDKCEQAYLAGAADEYLIQARRGELLLERKDYPNAEEMLRASLALNGQYSIAQAALNRLLSITKPATKPETKPASIQQDRAPEIVAEVGAQPIRKQETKAEILEEPSTTTTTASIFINSISAQGTSL